jgi:hypothetical protein
MSRPAALPARPARTMLSPVLGSNLLHGPRMVLRWARLALLGAISLGTLLPSAPALAQSADDSGWFDAPPAPEPTPEPYYEEPVVGDPGPASVPQTDIADTDPSALTTFRPALDPYGAWVADSTYGTVWVPNRDVVGADFAPYVSRGHWALTADDDWIWVSDYPFGWAVFHYGRWVWISGNGWAWIPGRTYANAWVVWRVPTAGYAYVGWAPMPPTWGWRNGYAFGLWYSPPLPYVFCPSAYVFDYRVHHHIVRDRHLVHDIAGHTHVYPTPYHAPARPSQRVAATPGVRPAPPPVGPSRAPRGPAVSAARVPASAVPAVRTAPPPNVQRLSPNRLAPVDAARQRVPSASEARVRSSSSPRVPADSRDFTRDARRTRPSPSSSWSEPRTSAPERVRGQPRTSAPERMRVEPRTSAPDRIRVEPRTSVPDRVRVEPRNAAPARIRVAPSPSRSFAPSPSRSFAPSRSFSPSPSRSMPSFPRTRSSGGSFRRR